MRTNPSRTYSIMITGRWLLQSFPRSADQDLVQSIALRSNSDPITPPTSGCGKPMEPPRDRVFRPVAPPMVAEGNELYPLPISHRIGDRASGEKRLSRGRRN